MSSIQVPKPSIWYSGSITKAGVTKSGAQPYKFGLAVGNKEYVNCICWHDTALVGLNPGDNIMVNGNFKEPREHNGKTYIDFEVYAASFVRKSRFSDTPVQDTTGSAPAEDVQF